MKNQENKPPVYITQTSTTENFKGIISTTPLLPVLLDQMSSHICPLQHPKNSRHVLGLFSQRNIRVGGRCACFHADSIPSACKDDCEPSLNHRVTDSPKREDNPSQAFSSKSLPVPKLIF